MLTSETSSVLSMICLQALRYIIKQLLYLIREYQRLKVEETNQQQPEWNLQRTLAKVNYTIHTDAIKEKLIPEKLTNFQTSLVYASEADGSFWENSSNFS